MDQNFFNIKSSEMGNAFTSNSSCSCCFVLLAKDGVSFSADQMWIGYFFFFITLTSPKKFILAEGW